MIDRYRGNERLNFEVRKRDWLSWFSLIVTKSERSSLWKQAEEDETHCVCVRVCVCVCTGVCV